MPHPDPALPTRPPATPTLGATTLMNALAGVRAPVLREGSGAWDGFTLAALGACWRDAYAATGLRRGDRVVVLLPPGAAFVGALLGALAHEATVALAPPGEDAHALLETLDARLAVSATSSAAAGGSVIAPARNGAPLAGRHVARQPHGANTRGVALLLRTSGSTGAGRWIALSPRNVGAVLRSHAHALPPAHAVVASVLPWHHVFGLVMELLPALARGGVLVREPSAGRDGASLARAITSHGATHLNAVPATMARLAAAPGGDAALDRLTGGLVGGAPVDATIAATLAHTRLRVGYGQTEAAPGIALGEPGEWSARFLGRPVGCEVRVDADGVLAFRGANAAVGEWRDGALVRREPGSWRRTGDVVREERGALWFQGRLSATFKLSNGRWVEAFRVEAALRERAPSLGDVLLTTIDGTGLLIVHGEDAPLDLAAVRASLGPLATLPVELRAIPREAWPRTPKGEIDRRGVQWLVERGA